MLSAHRACLEMWQACDRWRRPRVATNVIVIKYTIAIW